MLKVAGGGQKAGVGALDAGHAGAVELCVQACMHCTHGARANRDADLRSIDTCSSSSSSMGGYLPIYLPAAHPRVVPEGGVVGLQCAAMDLDEPGTRKNLVGALYAHNKQASTSVSTRENSEASPQYTI